MNKYILTMLALLCAVLTGSAQDRTTYHSPTDSVHRGIPHEYIDPLAEDSLVVPEFKRQIESNVFIPKGQWAGGISVNYSQTNQSKYQFLIVENLSGDTYSFKVSPMAMYFFKNDLAIGARFSYSRNLTKLEQGDIVVDSETGYTIENLYRLAHDYSGMVFLRNYFSMGRTMRFGFFYELQVEMGGGQSKLTNGKGADLTGAYTRDFHFNIGVAPGLVMFLNNNAAMEVNVGVLGFGVNTSKQITDRIYESNFKSESANFRINLFSITFGMTFFI